MRIGTCKGLKTYTQGVAIPSKVRCNSIRDCSRYQYFDEKVSFHRNMVVVLHPTSAKNQSHLYYFSPKKREKVYIVSSESTWVDGDGVDKPMMVAEFTVQFKR